MPASTESEIESLVTVFVANLTSLVRATALDIVQEALGASTASPGKRTTAARAATGATRRPKGAKRDRKDIEALTEMLAGFIKKTPGQRIEQIGKAIGIHTKELALPVKKLIAASRVFTKGQKRATTYFPGGTRSAKPVPRGKGGRMSAAKRGQKTVAKHGRPNTTAANSVVT